MHGLVKCALACAALVITLGCSSTRITQAPTPALPGQQARVFRGPVVQPVQLQYLLALPEGYDEDKQKKWPLVLFLHGMGERGSTLTNVAVHGPPKLVAQGRKFPFILVAPQCPLGDFWHAEQLIALLDDVKKQYRVDDDRVSVTGLSMGGYGTWELATTFPQYFAAAAPICGGGGIIPIAAANADRRANIKALPIWAFHGAKDNIVPLSESESMVNQLKRIGNNAKLTVYPNANHDSWTETYNNPELYSWLLQQTRQPAVKSWSSR